MQLCNVLLAYKDKGWDVYKAHHGELLHLRLLGRGAQVRERRRGPVGITLEDNAFRYVQGGGPVKIVYPRTGSSRPRTASPW